MTPILGALIQTPPSANPLSFKLAAAQTLGLSFHRTRIDLDNPVITPIQKGADNMINFNSSLIVSGEPKPFWGSKRKMKAALQAALKMLERKPIVAVINNEEDSLMYHCNGVANYIHIELDTAIEVLKEAGIPVTHGGFTWAFACYMAYKDMEAMALEQTGDEEKTNLLTKAHDFAIKTNIGFFTGKYKKTFHLQSYLTIKEYMRGMFLKYYPFMDLDYINFHIYTEDLGAIETVSGFLKRVFQKPLICNEFGSMTPSIAKDIDVEYLAFYCADKWNLLNADGSKNELGKLL